MRVLVVTHAVSRGGAQEFLLEMLGLMKKNGLDIAVLTSESAEQSFLLDLRKLDPNTHIVPYRATANYPDMALEKVPELVKSSDLVWLADEVYLVGPKAKKIESDVPVIAHIHCFAMLCPMWHKTYGLRETCTSKCSVRRIIRCKQLGNESLGELGVISKSRMAAHEVLDFVKGPMDFIRWPVKRDVIESIDGFVAPSKYVKDLVLAHLPQLETIPFDVIHNPAIVPEVGTGEIDRRGRLAMLYASGPGFLRGPHIALQATRELLDRGNEVQLNMVGVQGNTWIENLVARLGLEKHVELFPRLVRSELCKAMANSSLLLVPSIIPEGFGRSPVESNRFGTPAIVSDRGGLPETTIDGITGIIAEPSAHAFAKAVSIAMTTNWNRERIVDATRRFDPELIARNFIRFLERFT